MKANLSYFLFFFEQTQHFTISAGDRCMWALVTSLISVPTKTSTYWLYKLKTYWPTYWRFYSSLVSYWLKLLLCVTGSDHLVALVHARMVSPLSLPLPWPLPCLTTGLTTGMWWPTHNIDILWESEPGNFRVSGHIHIRVLNTNRSQWLEWPWNVERWALVHEGRIPHDKIHEIKTWKSHTQEMWLSHI